MTTTTDTRTWLDRAACTADDTFLFFPETNQESHLFTPDAKALCQACPVVAECLRWALETKQTYGTWGGMSAFEREKIITGPTPERTKCKNRHDLTLPGAKNGRGRCAECILDRYARVREARVRARATA